MTTTKLEWIQSLRAVAALMVLFFHIGPHLAAAPLLAPLQGLTQWGFSGVDIFFVLSGFVVYRTAKSSMQAYDTATFVRHRLLRVYSGYWPALIAFAFVSVVLLRVPLPPLEKILLSSVLAYHDLFDNWLGAAWSLTYELSFYGWIVVLVLLNRNKPYIPIFIAILFLVGWNGSWLALRPERVDGAQPFRYLFPAFGIEFFAGALISEGYARVGTAKIRTKAAVVLLGLALIAAGYAVGVRQPAFANIEVLRVATFGSAAIGFLLVFLCLEGSSLTPPKWLIRIGDASYSLYLLRTFLIDVEAVFWISIDRVVRSQWLPTVGLLITPVVIVAISLWWYQFVERPLLRLAIRKVG